MSISYWTMVRGLAPESDERIEVVQIYTRAENHFLLSNTTSCLQFSSRLEQAQNMAARDYSFETTIVNNRQLVEVFSTHHLERFCEGCLRHNGV